MTPAEFAEKLREIEREYGGDYEMAHGEADELLCKVLRELGYGEGVEVFDNMGKWYG